MTERCEEDFFFTNESVPVVAKTHRNKVLRHKGVSDLEKLTSCMKLAVEILF